MMHIAMFDAINAIEREYSPYRVPTAAWGWAALPVAAAAQAAHDVLVVINASWCIRSMTRPSARQLGQAPFGLRETRGAAIGAQCRAGRSWPGAGRSLDRPSFLPYVEPLLPGRWRPTPPNNPSLGLSRISRAPRRWRCCRRLNTRRFPPPFLTSAHYVDRRQRGEAHWQVEQRRPAPLRRPTSRTGGRASPSAVRLERPRRRCSRSGTTSPVTSIVARGLSLVDAARVFTLVNVSIHDSLHTTQTSKFVYGMWRPVTAIRNCRQRSERPHGPG